MKTYIKDEQTGKISHCDSNRAKMNIFEYIKYFGLEDLKYFYFNIFEYWKECLVTLIRILLTPVYPIILIIQGICTINRAKKEVLRYNKKS